MPIPRQKLEEALRPLRERVLGLLRDHPDEAYDLLELFGAIEGFERAKLEVMVYGMSESDVNRWTRPYVECLENLVAEQKVAKALYSGREYYAIIGPDVGGTRTPPD